MSAITTTTQSHPRRARCLLAVVTTLVAAVLASVLWQGSPAQAAVAGTTSFPVTLVGASTGPAPLSTATRWGRSFFFTVRAMDVQPSTTTSELQVARVHYEVQSKALSSTVWQTVATQDAAVDLSQWVANPWDISENESEMLVATGKRVPTVQFAGLRVATVAHYRVLASVTWSVEETGRQLGSVTLSPVVAGDLACNGGGNTKCQVTVSGSPMFVLQP